MNGRLILVVDEQEPKAFEESLRGFQIAGSTSTLHRGTDGSCSLGRVRVSHHGTLLSHQSGTFRARQLKVDRVCSQCTLSLQFVNHDHWGDMGRCRSRPGRSSSPVEESGNVALFRRWLGSLYGLLYPALREKAGGGHCSTCR